jgi:nicotinamidase/pyrazinamidase
MKKTIDRRRLLKAMSSAGVVATTGSLSSLVFAATPAPKLKLDAGTALLVIDVQNCFVSGGTLPVKGGEEVVPIINKIAANFQNIVVTQDWHTPGHASFASSYPGKKPFETTKLSYGTQVLWPDHCVQGTDDAALQKDLKLPTAQIIIRKGFHKNMDSYSAFDEADHKTATGLGGYLRARGIRTLYLTGLATDFCVAWTAIDARKAGFTVYVVEDATRAIDLNGSLAAAWKEMSSKGVKRIQSSDLA